jgi:hypothetical protein
MICGPCCNGDHKHCEDRSKKGRLYRSCPCHHVERPKAPEPEVKAPQSLAVTTTNEVPVVL